MDTKKARPTKQVQPTDVQQILNRFAIPVFIIVAFIFYGNTLRNGYAIDDKLNTHENPQVAQGFSAIPELFTSVYYQEEGNVGKLSFGYRPIAKVTFAIEAGLFGKSPVLLLKISHLINILLYALTILILFRVLQRLFKEWHPSYTFLATLIFLAHPLHTEVVASLKNREEILSLMGGLGALLFLIDYVRTNRTSKLIFSILCFAGGYLSKSSILTFLVIYPLSLYYFTDVKPKKLLLISALFLVTLIATQLLPKLWLPEQIRPNEFVENPLFFDHNLLNRFGTGMVVLLHYLTQLTINPANMAYYYGFDMFPIVSITSPVALFSLAIHLVLLGIALWQFRKKTAISFAILFYLVTISMYSNVLLPVVGIAADRFSFIPSIGFSIALAYFILLISRRQKENWTKLKPNSAILLSTMLVILIVYGSITINRNSDWKDLPTLYKADVDKLERSVKANTQYAGNLLSVISNEQPPRQPTREEVLSMIEHLKLSLKVKPDYFQALNTLGSIYTRLSMDDQAIELYLKAISVKPEISAGYTNLGLSYKNKGDYRNAIKAFKKTLTLEPGKLNAIFTLAEIYHTTGDIDSAIMMNKSAMLIDEESEIPYINIGNYYLIDHDTASAVEWWQKAVEKQPLEQLSHNLSLHFEQKGDQEKAAYYRQKEKEAKGVMIMHR